MKEVRKEIALTAEQKKAIETVIELSNGLAEKIGVFGGWAVNISELSPTEVDFRTWQVLWLMSRILNI